MKKLLYPAIVIIMASIFVAACSPKSEGDQVSGIEDLVLPSSAFPDSVTWDPHPPNGDTLLCGISGNPYITRDSSVINCFCSRWLGLPDSVTATVKGMMVQILYHDGEIGIYALEYTDAASAQLGYDALTSHHNSVRYSFVVGQKYTVWVWCDSENDTARVHQIADYYRNLLGS